MARLRLTKQVCKQIIKHGTDERFDFRQSIKNGKQKPFFGHLIGNVAQAYQQNSSRDERCGVYLGSDYVLCGVPCAKKGETLREGQLVIVSINRVSREYEIIGGEC